MLSSTFIDEFGFDRIERVECPEAAHLLYKIIAARNQKRSTAVVTNVDFEKWGEYLHRRSAGHGLPGSAGRASHRSEGHGQILPRLAGSTSRGGRSRKERVEVTSWPP